MHQRGAEIDVDCMRFLNVDENIRKSIINDMESKDERIKVESEFTCNRHGIITYMFLNELDLDEDEYEELISSFTEVCLAHDDEIFVEESIHLCW